MQRNRKIDHVHGLEESTQLKWPYYLKQYTDLMQLPSINQWHFLKKQNTNKEPPSDLYGTAKDPG